MLIVGDNSWVEVWEADDYLEDKWGADYWNQTAFSNFIKEQLLVTSFRWIFAYPFYAIPKTATKDSVKFAQIELANWLYKYGIPHEERMALQADGVDSFSLKGWAEKHIKEQSDLPQIVQEILIDELTHKGGYFPQTNRDFV